MPFNHTPTIELTTRRCVDCGRYYATEAWPSATCPYCADRKVDARRAEEARLGRVVSALRGALTRANKRKGSKR